MAIAATTVWELRATATAANANGGGFNPNNATPGTDYSQQAAAQYSFSDLATSNGTAASPVVSSASHSFVATDCGNLIHIVSGGTFLPAWYEIVSVSGGNATLDRACASGASTSAGVYSVGGALSLNSSTANQTDGDFFTTALQAGNKIWMKNGSFTLGITFTSRAGTLTAPIQWAGYNSTRGDNPTGANRPTLDVNTLAPIINNWTQMSNIIFTGTAATVLNCGSNTSLINAKVSNSSVTAARTGVLCGSNTVLVNSEFISYRGKALDVATATVYITGCYIHDSDIGMTTTTGLIAITDSIISDNVTSAIQSTSTGQIFTGNGNTFYGAENKLGKALLNFSTTNNFIAINNIIYGFVTGISLTGVYPNVYENYNDFFNNTTDVTNVTKGGNDQAINPAFVNVAQVTGTAGVVSGSTLTDGAANFANVTDNVDFCYIKSGTGATAGKYLITSHTATSLTLYTAPGGSGSNIAYQVTTGHNFAVGPALRGLGFPGAIPGASTTGYLTPGAIQSPTTTASVFAG